MKYILIILVLLAFLFCADAATVTFTMTNGVSAGDTNRIKLQQLQSYANADGTYQTVGLPFWIQPNTNGFISTNLAYGNWLATNSFIASQYQGPGMVGSSQGVLFAVPQSAGTYSFVQLAIPGYNVYNYNGAAFVATYSNIIAALGFTPPTFAQVTNIASGPTNGMTSIVYTNPSYYYPNYNPSNYASASQLSASNYATLAQLRDTNQLALNATTNMYNASIIALGLTNTSNLKVTTNLVNNATNGLLRATDAAQIYYPTSNPSAFISASSVTSGFVTLVQFVAGTNKVATNSLAQLQGTNTFILNALSASNALLAQAIIDSNFQANVQATNLANAATAAMKVTNGITRAALTATSILFEAKFTASNAWAKTFFYPTSNPSGFLTSLATNAQATTNFVQAYVATVLNNSNYATLFQVSQTNQSALNAATNTSNAAHAALIVTNDQIRISMNASSNSLLGSINGASNSILANVAGQIASARADAIATNNNTLGALAATNSALTLAFIATNNNTIILGSNNLAAQGTAITNFVNQSTNAINARLRYDEAKFGCDTNFLVVFGGATGNGTNTWTGSAWTNGVNFVSNSIIYVGGIAAYGSSFVAGNGWTNINGFAPQPSTFFLPITNIASTGITIARSYGALTWSSSGGGGGGSATNVTTTNLLGIVGGAITNVGGIGLTNLQIVLNTAFTNLILGIVPASGGVTNASLNKYTTNTTALADAYVTNTVAEHLGAVKDSTNALGIASGLSAFTSTNRFLESGPIGNQDGSLLSKVPGTTISVDATMTLVNTVNANGTTNYALTAVGPIVQMVFKGTNNPNGFQTAPMGAIYNQFLTGTSNFLFQWVNTNSATGWY
jgi:hypothetical protein